MRAVSSANAFSQTAGNTTVNGGALSTGQINIAGGSLVFETALTNTAQTGSIMLSGGSLVEFAAAADSAEQVGFSGAGTIQLDVGALFAGTIFHFTSLGEAVDIRDLSDTNNDAHTSFDIATNRLTVLGDKLQRAVGVFEPNRKPIPPQRPILGLIRFKRHLVETAVGIALHGENPVDCFIHF